MIKKKAFIILLSVILSISLVFVIIYGLFGDPKKSITPHKQISLEDISVLMQEYEPTDGIYTEFVLRIGDTYIPFKGELLANRTPPKIYLADITNDNHKDIVVIFQSDAGTGIYGEDIHVFDGVTFDQYNVDYLPESIDDYVKVTTENGKHTITVAGKEYTINTDDLPGYNPSEAEYLYIDKQYYKYEISDGTLKILFSCGIWKYGTCGSVEVTFINNESNFVFNSAFFCQQNLV